MQSPPFPRYLVPPRARYFPQHHVLKHPHLPFLPQCQQYKSFSSSLCNLLHSTVTSSLLGPNNLFKTIVLDVVIFQMYFWNKTLHVSDSSSVHHQQFFTHQWYMSYKFAVCKVKNSWWWREGQSETCRILFQKQIWEINVSSWFHHKKFKPVAIYLPSPDFPMANSVWHFPDPLLWQRNCCNSWSKQNDPQTFYIEKCFEVLYINKCNVKVKQSH